MRRPKDKNRDIKLRGRFIPVFFETRRTAAWKAMSMGARELYMALSRLLKFRFSQPHPAFDTGSVVLG